MLVFGQCAVAGLHTLQHLEETEGGGGGVNMVRNAFVADQCTEFIFAFTPLLLLCFFGFI